ncbi:MAG: hypothetical protein GY938_22700, partial [Ketobacter sp.]|nr:hypothetical protein [Ketobacter sp.]
VPTQNTNTNTSLRRRKSKTKRVKRKLSTIHETTDNETLRQKQRFDSTELKRNQGSMVVSPQSNDITSMQIENQNEMNTSIFEFDSEKKGTKRKADKPIAVKGSDVKKLKRESTPKVSGSKRSNLSSNLNDGTPSKDSNKRQRLKLFKTVRKPWESPTKSTDKK